MASSEKVLSRSPTCWCSIADREGGQCGVQAIDGIVEMLGEEDMVLRWLTGQSV